MNSPDPINQLTGDIVLILCGLALFAAGAVLTSLFHRAQPRHRPWEEPDSE